MKVVVYLIGSDSAFQVAETLEYEKVARVSVAESSGVSSVLRLHRGCGDVGIPFIRVHHWEETKNMREEAEGRSS